MIGLIKSSAIFITQSSGMWKWHRGCSHKVLYWGDDMRFMSRCAGLDCADFGLRMDFDG